MFWNTALIEAFWCQNNESHKPTNIVKLLKFKYIIRVVIVWLPYYKILALETRSIAIQYNKKLQIAQQIQW